MPITVLIGFLWLHVDSAFSISSNVLTISLSVFLPEASDTSLLLRSPLYSTTFLLHLTSCLTSTMTLINVEPGTIYSTLISPLSPFLTTDTNQLFQGRITSVDILMKCIDFCLKLNSELHDWNCATNTKDRPVLCFNVLSLKVTTTWIKSCSVVGKYS